MRCSLIIVILLSTLSGYVTIVASRNDKILKLGYLTETELPPGMKHRANERYNLEGKRVSGAITYAVETINNDTKILPDHKLEFVVAETYGMELHSVKTTVELLKQNISAYIGPLHTCIHEGKIASAYNIPMISYYCMSHETSNKNKYPTFARTKPPNDQIVRAAVTLLKEYDWKKVVLVYGDVYNGESYAKLLESHHIKVISKERFNGTYVYNGEPDADHRFDDIVTRTYQHCRIYVMAARDHEFIGLMTALHRKGLLKDGKYFVVGLNVFTNEDIEVYLTGIVSIWHQVPIEAFASFIGVIPSRAENMEVLYNFTAKVNYYRQRPPFNFVNAFQKLLIPLRVPPEAYYLYDAVLLYATAADQAIRDGVSPSDGRAILKYMKGVTYESAMGYENSLDENGDALGNFTLIRRFELTRGNWTMKPFATFQAPPVSSHENQTAQVLPVLVMYENETFNFIGGKPPLDEPECGFDGQKCQQDNKSRMGIIIGGAALGCLTIIAITASVLCYRSYQYEQDLAKMLWKIDWRDVVINDSYISNGIQSPGTMAKLKNMSTALRSSTITLDSQGGEVENRQLFTLVATWKSITVAVKRINLKHVDLTREVKKELKLMRDLRHDNVTTFIGACVDVPNVCILTEYCPKGSLQDVLENDDVKLDNIFIASLVNDIIKGILFIHDSELRIHGNLKSSNCVIDTRWVLKLADFGMHEFRRNEVKDDWGEHAYYRSLFWKAPELLRDDSVYGTQKGDTYSFAVILWEIYARTSPYSSSSLTPRAIVDKVKHPESTHPFRPRLAVLDSVPKFVTDCIEVCWTENPQLRPDFKTIRILLKPLQKGMKPNIMDNMISIMEKYATNLESIIEERTEQLAKEKEKTEELLHQMLPKSVAEQLKLGKSVEAESFDSVSIYFSDICGFTSMSSESTPMQVVDLLNDLYTCFDSIIDNYDVYKVETIGDAYMVVSGLPTRNGINHAGEIGSMSLHLLNKLKKFKIRHRPNEILKLRIGIHSGSCVAGVVGLKMPRYCLFGDTVNTSSRMESTGLPLKIHCSPQCKNLLDKLGGFITEPRGMTAMKGKGEVMTYWLLGKGDKPSPDVIIDQSFVNMHDLPNGLHNQSYLTDENEGNFYSPPEMNRLQPDLNCNEQKHRKKSNSKSPFRKLSRGSKKKQDDESGEFLSLTNVYDHKRKKSSSSVASISPGQKKTSSGKGLKPEETALLQQRV